MFLHTVKKSASIVSPSLISRRVISTQIAALALSASAGVNAYTFDTSNRDLRISWDNTVKYSAALRLKDRDADVMGSSHSANLDDGDRNFDKGLISNRVDLLSQFDLSYNRQYGLRLTGAAWYDDVYQHHTDNDGLGANNNLQGGATAFPEDTKKLHGGDAELLDAFVYGNKDFGEKGVSLKVGRFAQLYGTSLFFGGNGIAAAQSPIDIVKALSVPGSTFQEIIRPVGQIAGTFIYSSDLSISAYYQYEWEKSVLPGAGSYFSVSDTVGDGAQTLSDSRLGRLNRNDLEPKDSGQMGAAVKVKAGGYDFGFYAAQYHDKLPQLYAKPNGLGGGTYDLVYGENIQTFGTSISNSFGDTNVAAEVSYRNNMPLAATGNLVVIIPNSGQVGDGDNNALYPVGKTVHAQVSAISLFNGNSLWDGATLLGELAYNHIASVDKNENQLDPNTTRDASAVRVLFSPQYFEVISGLDLTMPIGLGYGLSGNTAIGGTGFSPKGTGDLSLGVNFDYQRVWQGGLQVTHYFGSAGAYLNDAQTPQISGNQAYADRDFISFNVKRSF